jgi:peptidylprolyl isomerase
MRIPAITIAVAMAVLVVGCDKSAAPPVSTENTPMPAAAPASRTTASGLTIVDVQPGTGPEAKTGDHVLVNYRGRLQSTGAQFDSSYDRGQPFDFNLGAGQVIRGWDEGVAGMKVGGKRQLTIPPDLGYGANGAGGVIPPNATLVFDVELVGIR